MSLVLAGQREQKADGCLPQARSSPVMSLGDVFMKDSGSGAGRERSTLRCRLFKLDSLVDVPVAGDSPALREKQSSDSDQVVKFEFQARVPIQLVGPRSWVGFASGRAQIGFRPTEGLGFLSMWEGHHVNFPCACPSSGLGSRAPRASGRLWLWWVGRKRRLDSMAMGSDL